MTAKKKKVVPKATRVRRLVKKCRAVTSLLVRTRDGECVICALAGKGTSDPKKLNAHHWIISDARSVKHRFNPANLISLCWAHHLHGVHKEASYSYVLKLKEAAISRGIVTEEEVDSIAHDDETITLTEPWLQAKLQKLESLLESQSCVSSCDPPPKEAAGSCNGSNASAPRD